MLMQDWVFRLGFCLFCFELLLAVFQPIFFLLHILVDSFYYVNYVNVNYSVKYSTFDCKYLLFLQDFFFRLKPKQYKKCQYSRLFKKTIWKLIKNKVNIYNQQLNFWLNNWRLHNWRSRKPQLKKPAKNNGRGSTAIEFRCHTHRSDTFVSPCIL